LILFLDRCEMTHRPWMPYERPNGELLSFLLSGTRVKGAAGRAEGFAVRSRFGNAGREWWREAERMKGRGVTPHLHVRGEVPEEG
jgi:hypothetical protein